MEVTYRVERKDLWYGAWYTNFAHPQARFVWVFSVFCMLVMLSPQFATHRPTAMIGFVAYVATFAITIVGLIGFNVLKRMPSAGTVRWCTEVIDPWGFRCYVPEGERRATWLQVKRIKETSAYFFVFTTNGKSYFIPKRAFASPEHARAYLAQANAYWDAARRGMPLPPMPIRSMGSVPAPWQQPQTQSQPAGVEGVWPPPPTAPRV